VDCDEPFEEDFVCPEENVLYKETAKELIINDDKEQIHTSYNYFDALGRKLKQEDVFAVKRPLYIKSQQYNSLQSNSKNKSKQFEVLLKTISGYVEAKTYLGFENISFICSFQETIIMLDLYMETPKESIKINLDSDDQILLAHENKHKDIYEMYGTKYWHNEKIILNYQVKKNEVCSIVKQYFWPVMGGAYRELLNMHNAWDDEDKNNISHERINIENKVAEQKLIWFFNSCNQE
jgi:hypothetical protein